MFAGVKPQMVGRETVGAPTRRHSCRGTPQATEQREPEAPVRREG